MSSISLRSGRPGGPQVEALRESRDLRAAVSPQSIYSYDEKRADYVQYPQGAGDGWEKLSSALSKLNPQLNQMAAVQEERFFMEQTAIGKSLMSENQKAWSEFIKENPQYAGLNPHLERGYKGAELATKAQSYHAALQNHYTTGGLVNETDPEKVQAKVGEFTKNWTAEHITEQYEPELYAEHFLKAVTASEGALMNRHTGDRAEEHLKLAEEKYGQLFASDIDSALDNTPNISNPQVLSGALDTLASRAANLIQAMETSGVPRSRAIAVIGNAVLNIAKAEGEEGHGAEILSLAKRIKTEAGVLGSSPEFQGKVHALHDEWKQERRQKNSEYIQMWHFNKAKAQEKAVTSIGGKFMHCLKNGLPAPTVQDIVALPDVGPEHLDVAASLSNTFNSLATHKPIMDQQRTAEYAADMHLAQTGRMTPEQAVLKAEKYGRENWMPLYSAASAGQDEADPVSAVLKGHDFKNSEDILVGQLFAGNAPAADSPIFKARVVEAKATLADKVAVYVEEGVRKNEPRTPAAIRNFLNTQAREIGADPYFRDTGTQRDIISPEERQRMATPEYWSTNNRLHIRETEDVDKLLNASLKHDKKTVIGFLNKYGVLPELIDSFIENQAYLHNIDIEAAARKYNETLRKEEKAREWSKMVDPYFGLYTAPVKEEYDGTTETGHSRSQAPSSTR